MNNLTEESGMLGRMAKLQEDNHNLTVAAGKLAGALEFTVAVLQKLAEEGSELAKASLESLNEESNKEE